MSTAMSFSKKIYTKEALLKAAYAFTDCFYIHLDTDSENYIVISAPKTITAKNLLPEEFENELIAQETRRLIAERTKNIREIIVARALSSTIVNVSESMDESRKEYHVENILKDWFDENK